MQRVDGAEAQGFVAREYQELLRIAILPEIQQFCNREFRVGANDWFDLDLYERFKSDLDWPADEQGSAFLLSEDCDTRHTKFVTEGRKEHPELARLDRRDIPKGKWGHLALKRRQEVPSAPKVPDTVQNPIELLFAQVKEHYHKSSGDSQGGDWASMWELVKAAFTARATPERIYKLYQHALKALMVWSGPAGHWLDIDGTAYMCTGGDVICRRLRA